MEFKKKFYVKKYKSFDRRSGATGQEIVVRNPDGYSCSIKCLDKELVDLSSVKVNTEVEFYCDTEFIVVKGERYYQNILSVVIVDFA